MGLYYSQLKKRQQAQAQPRLIETATGGVMVDEQGNEVESYVGSIGDERRQQAAQTGRLPESSISTVSPDFEERQAAIKERGGVLARDPQTGQERYFVDSPVKAVSGKTWEEMNGLEKFVASGDKAEAYAKSIGGNVVLGASSMATKGAGFLGRILDKTTGAEFVMDKMGVEKTPAQELLDFAQKIDEYKAKEYGTVSYQQEDVTLKNVPKLLKNPEFVLNGLTSMVQSGLLWKGGGMPALTGVEGGDLLSERRVNAILNGEKEETTGEVLFSAGMGLFNAWLENMSFKVMSGGQKIPVTDALIKKISNGIARNVVKWGERVATEMGEEFLQEGLPILVAEAIFHDRGSLSTAFKEALSTGEKAAVMAIPGAGLLSGVSLVQEQGMENKQKSLDKKQSYLDKSKNIRGSFLSEVKQLEANSGEGTTMQDGKLAKSLVESRSFDIGAKIAQTFGEKVGKSVTETLKKGEYSNPEQFIEAAETAILESIPKSERAAYQEAIETAKKETYITESGVRLKEGEGEKVYRGENSEAQAKVKGLGLESVFGDGLYVTKDMGMAQKYAGEKGNVVDMNIDPKAKVLKFNDQAERIAFEREAIKAYPELTGDRQTGKAQQALAKERGYQVVDLSATDDGSSGIFILDESVLTKSSPATQQIEAEKTKIAEESSEKIKAGKEAAGMVRLPGIIPREHLKFLFEEAKAQGLDETLGTAINSPLEQDKINSLDTNQKTFISTILNSIAVTEGLNSGAIIENIQNLGGTFTGTPSEAASSPTSSVAPNQTTPTTKEGKVVGESTATIGAKTPITAENFDRAIAKVQQMDIDMGNKTAKTREEASNQREILRQNIADFLKKDSISLVDLAGGKNNAPAFTLSVKKLPGGKYGYGISMNTPNASMAVLYSPKFGSVQRASRMGVQRAIRMIEEARQAGVPAAGLARMRNAVMAVNKKLGKSALPTSKVKKIVKETKKKAGIPGKTKKTAIPGEIKEKQTASPASELASKGATALGNFEQVATKEVADEAFKIYEKVRGLIEKYATRIGEGYLPRGTSGVYKRIINTIRVRGLNDLSVASHEIAHHLDIANTKMSSKVIMETSQGDKFRRMLTDLYEEYYPGGKRTHKLETRIVEGFATLLQKYAEIPSTIEKKYPELVEAYFKPGGRFYSKLFADLIADLRGIIGEYQGLTNLDKMTARLVSDELKTGKQILSLKDQIKTVITDAIYPLEAIAKRAGKHFSEEDISLWARLFDSAQSAILSNNVFGKGGFVKGYTRLVNGRPVQTLDYNWKDLVNKIAGYYDTFGAFLIGRRKYFEFEEQKELKKAIDLVTPEMEAFMKMFDPEPFAQFEEKKERLKKLEEIIKNDGITEEEATGAYLEGKERFKEAAKMYDELVNEDLKFAYDSLVQLLSAEDFAKLSSNKGYASFKREFYDDVIGDSEVMPRHLMVGKNKISSLVRRRGSSRAIVNPVAGAIWNHAEFLKKGMRQIVYNKAAEYAVSMPDVFERIQLKAIPDENGVIHFPQEKDPNIIMARINHKRVPILVDSTIKQVFDNALTFQNVGAFGKFMLVSARFFTKGTTGLYVQFPFSNIPIDQLTASAQSKYNYIPIYSAIKELYTTLTQEDSVERKYATEYLMLGGERQTMVGWQDASPRELMDMIRNEATGIKKVTKVINKTGEIIGLPSGYSEIASRMVEFIKARKAGESPVAALERAGRVTAPFHHKGSWGDFGFMQVWIRTIPFFNPAIQVVAQAAETLNSPQGRKKFLVVAAAVSASQIAAMGLLLSGASDEQKRKYAGLHPEELSQFLFVPSPFDKHSLLKLRIPNTLTFMSMPINMMIADRMLNTGYTLGEYYTGMTSFLPQQLNPGNLGKDGAGKLLVGWLPQIIKIPLLTALNYKDYPNLMPLESQAMQRKLPSERYTEYTSKVAKLLGGATGWSPTKIDYLLTGFFGRFIGYFTIKPSAYRIDNVFLQQEYYNSSRQIQKYYDVLEKNNQAYNTYKGKPGKEKQFQEVSVQKAKLKQIDSYMDNLKEIDEEKNPVQAEKLRQEIFNLIDTL